MPTPSLPAPPAPALPVPKPLRGAALLLAGSLSLALGSASSQGAAPAAPAPALSAPVPNMPAPSAPAPSTPAPGVAAPAETAPAQATPVPATAVLATPAAPALTLTDVLRGLPAGPGWRSADLSYRAAELQLAAAQARAGLSLSVGGSASAAKYPWDTGEWQGSAALSANLALPLLPWSPQREAVRSAERALGAAATELRSARAALTVQAVQAYAGARSAALGLSAAQAQVALAGRLLEVAQAQREQNLVPLSSLLERQIGLEQARAALVQAEQNLTLAEAGLGRLLGRPLRLPRDPAAYAELDGFAARALPGLRLPELALPSPSGVPGQTGELGEAELGALVARALSQRPEPARAAAALADARVALDTATRDQRLPDLSASVQAGQLGATAGQGRTAGASFGLRSGTLGAQLSVPLREATGPVTVPGPDGVPVTSVQTLPSGVALSLSASVPLLGSGRSQATALAQAGVGQAELAAENVRQATELEVRTRASEYAQALSAQRAAELSLTRAQNDLQSAQVRLTVGLGTPLEVAQAEFGVLRARSDLDGRRAALTLAALQLAQATGDLDPLLVSS